MTEALRTACAVISSAAGCPDLVAFLLPGIVSKCAAILLPPVPNKVPSSASEAALNLLASTLACALDPTTMSCKEVRTDAASELRASSAADAVAQLRIVSEGTPSTSKSGLAPAKNTASSSNSNRAGRTDFLVARDSDWLKETCAHLHVLFQKVLPRVGAHTASRVRAALARMLATTLAATATALGDQLLDVCMDTLLQRSLEAVPAARRPAEELLGTLQHGDGDDRRACRASNSQASLCKPLIPGGKAALKDSVVRLLPAALEMLAAALYQPAQHVTTAAHAVAGCIRALPAVHAAQLVAMNPARRQAILAAVAQFMQVDDGVAALWLQGHASQDALRARLAADQSLDAGPGSAPTAQQTSSEKPAASRADAAQAGSPDVICTNSVAEHELGDGEMKAGASATARAPPRMPLGLKHVHTEEVYAAIAEVGRSLGAACAAARHDASSRSATVAVLDDVRRSMEACSRHARCRGASREQGAFHAALFIQSCVQSSNPRKR